MVICVSGLISVPYSFLAFTHNLSRSSGKPFICVYWLKSFFMAVFTKEVSSSLIEKSGKPWPRFTALHSVASWLITVKIVVPTSGNFDCICIDILSFTLIVLKYEPVFHHQSFPPVPPASNG